MTHKLDKGTMIKVEVIVMLHNEERHLIIQALNRHITVKEIAECFSVNTSTTVYHPSSHLCRLPGERSSAVRAAADGLHAITLDMGQTRVSAAAIGAAAGCQVDRYCLDIPFMPSQPYILSPKKPSHI